MESTMIYNKKNYTITKKIYPIKAGKKHGYNYML